MVMCITGRELRSQPAANRAADCQIFARHKCRIYRRR